MTFNINLSFENSPKVVASETKRVGEEEEEEEYVYVRHKPVINNLFQIKKISPGASASSGAASQRSR